ncbi:hypothetical protein DBR24_08230 [Pseudomonas sp. HMWF006]|nr:hypothetical protein DBR24_08230 [Pseudomonas sp. HMWF006]PTT74122.1 hypothetical protein DBR26_01330 [Pseudomonas sp. HMWF007]RON60483.1 hypothetical protein BK669_23955 [Pseudomonas fluorescens]
MLHRADKIRNLKEIDEGLRLLDGCIRQGGGNLFGEPFTCFGSFCSGDNRFFCLLSDGALHAANGQCNR